MKFKKYGSIENSYRQKSVQFAEIEFGREEFVVQEKVHGSNFSFWIDETNVVKCGKRSGLISEGESFFNHTKILDKYENNIQDIFQKMVSLFDVKELAVFGEIYGGVYPHDDVENLQVSKVQSGVFYNNDVDFIAFDIMCDGVYFNFDQFIGMCSSVGLPFLPAIFRGSLADCLNQPNLYQTTIPKLHGLPEIENNTGEGNVIRPVNVLHFGNGSRVIFKNKNDKFSEKEHKKQPKAPQEPLPDHLLKLNEEAYKYVTENRLRNVLSKIGQINEKEFGKLLGLYSKDVVEDFAKDFPDYLTLELKERKKVTRFINGQCGNTIRPNFLNIVDGEF